VSIEEVVGGPSQSLLLLAYPQWIPGYALCSAFFSLEFYVLGGRFGPRNFVLRQPTLCKNVRLTIEEVI
jgi:hypothetical protein